MHERSDRNGYIYLFRGENVPLIKTDAAIPSDSDFADVQIGTLHIIRLADMHYLGTDGKWLPVTPAAPKTRSDR